MLLALFIKWNAKSGPSLGLAPGPHPHRCLIAPVVCQHRDPARNNAQPRRIITFDCVNRKPITGAMPTIERGTEPLTYRYESRRAFPQRHSWFCLKELRYTVNRMKNEPSTRISSLNNIICNTIFLIFFLGCWVRSFRVPVTSRSKVWICCPKLLYNRLQMTSSYWRNQNGFGVTNLFQLTSPGILGNLVNLFVIFFGFIQSIF